MIRRWHYSATFESGTRWEDVVEDNNESTANVQAKQLLERFAASESEPIERLVTFDLVFTEPSL